MKDNIDYCPYESGDQVPVQKDRVTISDVAEFVDMKNFVGSPKKILK